MKYIMLVFDSVYNDGKNIYTNSYYAKIYFKLPVALMALFYLESVKKRVLVRFIKNIVSR